MSTVAQMNQREEEDGGCRGVLRGTCEPRSVFIPGISDRKELDSRALQMESGSPTPSL